MLIFSRRRATAVICLTWIGVLTVTIPIHAQLVQTNNETMQGFTLDTKQDLIFHKLAVVTNDSTYGDTADFNAATIPGDEADADSSATQNAHLTDGTAPKDPQSHRADGNAFAGVGDGLVLTYTLDKPSTVTEIDTYSGWQDQGRINQNYLLSYSTDGGKTYTKLNDVSAKPTAEHEEPYAIKVALTGTLKGVTNVRFTFKSTQNAAVSLTEIAVLGTPAGPVAKPVGQK